MAAPALPPALLADIFGNEGRDQIGRDGIEDSLADYLILPNNIPAAVAPAILLDHVIRHVNYTNPTAVGILVNGINRPLCMPQKMDLLRGQAPGADDIILAWDGEFMNSAPFIEHQDHGHTQYPLQ
mmetsp:Transcript_11199/g.24619  ORF Transcript_11199/g.24619 Transcript_11199/m.24619 type:complete len:126 (+) Transcript_11199:114-491(+)